MGGGSRGTCGRSIPTLPAEHLTKHYSHTSISWSFSPPFFYTYSISTAAMQQESLCSTYCFFFFASKERNMKEGWREKRIAFLPSGAHSACYRAPHQKQQKSNSHANTSLPVYRTQIRKTATLHHRPQTMSGKTRQITQM